MAPSNECVTMAVSLAIIVCLTSYCAANPTYGTQPVAPAGGTAVAAIVSHPTVTVTAKPAAVPAVSYDVPKPSLYPSSAKSQYKYPYPPATVYVDQPHPYYVAPVPTKTPTTTEPPPPTGIWKIFSIFSLPSFLSHKPEVVEEVPPVYADKPPTVDPAILPQSPSLSSYYNTYAVAPQPYPLYNVPTSGDVGLYKNKQPVYTYYSDGHPVQQYYHSQPTNTYGGYGYGYNYGHRPEVHTSTTSKHTGPTTVAPSKLPSYSIYLVPSKPEQRPAQPASASYGNPYASAYNYYDYQQPSQNYNNDYPQIPFHFGHHHTHHTTTKKPLHCKDDTLSTKRTGSAAVQSPDELLVKANVGSADVQSSTTTSILESTATTAAPTSAATTTTSLTSSTSVSSSSESPLPVQAKTLVSEVEPDNSNWVPLI